MRATFRLAALAALAVQLLATPGIGAQPAWGDETGDVAAAQALLTIEMPGKAVRVMRSLPPKIAGQDGASVDPVVLTAVQKAVDAAYGEGAVLRALAEAVATARGGAATPDLTGPAQRLTAASASLEEPQDGVDPFDRAKELEAALDARADRARIAELSGLMAGPELAAEVALTALRIQRAFSLPGKAGGDAGLDRSAALAAIAPFLTSSRAEAANQAGPFNRADVMAVAKANLQVMLSLLPEADIQILHNFYSSPAGKKERDALVKAFARENDRNAEAMLHAFVTAQAEASDKEPSP